MWSLRRLRGRWARLPARGLDLSIMQCRVEGSDRVALAKGGIDGWLGISTGCVSS